MELELPWLLAPDLPSNRSSSKDLKCTHSNYGALLPSLDVVAISQAPSLESNPDSPLPIANKGGMAHPFNL